MILMILKRNLMNNVNPNVVKVEGASTPKICKLIVVRTLSILRGTLGNNVCRRAKFR